jgi:CrcB protein
MAFFYLSLIVGGALGTCLRYWFVSLAITLFPEGELAYGTLGANIIGSFLIGIFFVAIHDKGFVPDTYKPFLVTGFLGSFTTFSSFSLETVHHLLEGQYLQALSYVLLSVVLCLFFCFLGIYITRSI